MVDILEQMFSQVLPWAGNGIAWVVEKIIKWAASYGIGITSLQSKILTLIILGLGFYVVYGVLKIGKKIIKIPLLVLIIFLIISVIISLFP